MRATVDRAGLDSQGRASKVQIRRVKKGDLSRIRDVIEQTFADFLERQVGTRPRQAFGGAQYVHHRWLMEPWGCFVAEEDGAKIVGTALAVNWGSVGILGPVEARRNKDDERRFASGPAVQSRRQGPPTVGLRRTLRYRHLVERPGSWLGQFDLEDANLPRCSGGS